MTTLHRSLAPLFLIGLLAVLGSGPSIQSRYTVRVSADSVLHRAIEQLVEESAPGYVQERGFLRNAVQRFYRNREYAPAWLIDGVPRADADTLLARLRRAGHHGLAPVDYRTDELAQQLDATGAATPDDLARLDVALSFAFMDYAADLHGGRISPDAVDPRWYTDKKRPDYAAHLEMALGPRSVARMLHDLAPSHPGYQRLRHALATYRSLAHGSGWPAIPDGDILHPGDTSARVVPLRRHLALTGELNAAYAAEQDSAYDDALAQAVHRFQQRHGLTTDSLLGPETRAALNVPIEERIRQIELNLERWRWLPDSLGERYVLVNIPAFRLYAYEGSEPVEKMSVIVGSAYAGRSTPIFTDEMEHLIFSPYWNVPHSIAVGEILPKARGNRAYLVEDNFQIVSHYGPGAQVYDPTSTSLSRVASGELRLREKPGPTNALGLVKFMFPNRLSIYLHDTPADHLFEKAERDFSHGCIRVERPVDLAVFALSHKPGWTRERIKNAMHNGKWQKVELEASIPVYIVYWTAFVEHDGRVQFRKDLYGHDDPLEAALYAGTDGTPS